MFEVVSRPARPQAPIAVPPYDLWKSHGGETIATFHRVDGGFYLRFLDRGDFAVDLAARRVESFPHPDVAPDQERDLVANQLMPLLWNYEGGLVLHASAVRTPQGIIAFMAPTGRGKSTLAANFAQAGYPFLTDDGLILQQEEGRPGYTVKPNQPFIRLYPDSALAVLGDKADAEMRAAVENDDAPKARLAPDSSVPYCDESAPLHRIYLLVEPSSDQVTFSQLGQTAALDALLQHSFMLDVEDRALMRRHFHKLASLSETVGIFALDYPRDYSKVRLVVQSILNHAKDGGFGQVL